MNAINRRQEATCIGCGCTDSRACLPLVGEPCHWERVDYQLGIGVCSECPEKIELFEKNVIKIRGIAQKVRSGMKHDAVAMNGCRVSLEMKR